jgi:invasion protein IalB
MMLREARMMPSVVPMGAPWTVGLVAAALALAAPAALAQPAAQQAQAQPPANPPAAATPPAASPPAAAPSPTLSDVPAAERTTAQFADWGMQCVPRPPAPQGQPAQTGKLCEILQIVQNQQQQPVSVLAVGRAQRTDPLKMVVRLPASVLVNTPVRMVFEGNEAALTLPFRHCLPTPPSCFAEIDMRDESLVRRLRIRTAEQGARLEWRDPAGNPQQVPVSFRGFSAALDALQREGT